MSWAPSSVQLDSVWYNSSLTACAALLHARASKHGGAACGTPFRWRPAARSIVIRRATSISEWCDGRRRRQKWQAPISISGKLAADAVQKEKLSSSSSSYLSFPEGSGVPSELLVRGGFSVQRAAGEVGGI